MDIKLYLKWLFSRWYLYILALLWFLYTGGTNGITSIVLVEVILGSLIGNILLWALIISFIVGIKNLFSLFSRSSTSS
jgi:hypothetical protein